jgi:hypothetical protein
MDEWTSGWKTTGDGQGSPADCVDGEDSDSNIVETPNTVPWSRVRSSTVR